MSLCINKKKLRSQLVDVSEAYIRTEDLYKPRYTSTVVTRQLVWICLVSYHHLGLLVYEPLS